LVSDKGFQYVLDGTLLADGPNLTMDVKKRFGLELKYFINQLKPLSSILQ
jgi:hypothetical protein